MANNITIKLNGEDAQFDNALSVKLQYDIFSSYSPDYRGLPSTFSLKLPKTNLNLTLYLSVNTVEIWVTGLLVIAGQFNIQKEDEDYWEGVVSSTQENWVKVLQDNTLRQIKNFKGQEQSLFASSARFTEYFTKAYHQQALQYNLNEVLFGHINNTYNYWTADRNDYENNTFRNQILNQGDYKPWLAVNPLSTPILSYGKFYRLPIKEIIAVDDNGKINNPTNNGIFKYLDEAYYLPTGSGVNAQIPPTNGNLYFKKLSDQSIMFPFENAVVLRLCVNEVNSLDTKQGKFTAEVMDTASWQKVDENEIYEVYYTSARSGDNLYDFVDRNGVKTLKNYTTRKIEGKFAVLSDKVRNNLLVDTLFIDDIPPVVNKLSILQNIFGQFDIILKLKSDLYDVLSNSYLTYSGSKDFELPYRKQNSYRFSLDRDIDRYHNKAPFGKTFRNRLGIFDYLGGRYDEFFHNGYSLSRFWNYVKANTTPASSALEYDVTTWYQILPFTLYKIDDSTIIGGNTIGANYLYNTETNFPYQLNTVPDNNTNYYLDSSTLSTSKWDFGTDTNVQQNVPPDRSSPLFYGGAYRCPASGSVDIKLVLDVRNISGLFNDNGDSVWGTSTNSYMKPSVIMICKLAEFENFETFDQELIEKLVKGYVEREGRYNDRIVYYKNLVIPAGTNNWRLETIEHTINTTFTVNKNDKIVLVVGTPSFRDLTTEYQTKYPVNKSPKYKMNEATSYCDLTFNGDYLVDVSKNLTETTQMTYFKDILVQHKLLPIYEPITRVMTLKSYSDCENEEGFIDLNNTFSYKEADININKPYKSINIGFPLEDKDYLLKKTPQTYNFYWENPDFTGFDLDSYEYLFSYSTAENTEYNFISTNTDTNISYSPALIEKFYTKHTSSLDYLPKVAKSVATITDKDNFVKSGFDVNWSFDYSPREVTYNVGVGHLETEFFDDLSIRQYFWNSSEVNKPFTDIQNGYYTRNLTYQTLNLYQITDHYIVGTRKLVLVDSTKNPTDVQASSNFHNGYYNQSQSQSLPYLAVKTFDYKLYWERCYKFKFPEEVKSNNEYVVKGFLDVLDYKSIVKGTVLAWFNNAWYNIISINSYNPVSEEAELTLIKNKYGR